jgi:hypothetical protein
MRHSNRCCRIFLIFAAFLSTCAAQEAVVQRRANLRRDPSTNRSPIRVLLPDENVEVLDALPSARYTKIRTEDKKVGWVLKTAIQVFGPTPKKGAQDIIKTTANATTPAPPPILPGPISPSWHPNHSSGAVKWQW